MSHKIHLEVASAGALGAVYGTERSVVRGGVSSRSADHNRW
jgi:hypothetical protein